MSEIDLNGKLLIAMPEMGDPRFAYSVIFLCAYSEEGAMGLVINKPTDDLRLTNLLEQLEITQNDDARDIALPGRFRTFVLRKRGKVPCVACVRSDEGARASNER